ncbi:hypothetical protein [Heyndrickxia sporothermodurans]|nr:hypothetical protein [Heyndrickxia sporothermodurans]
MKRYLKAAGSVLLAGMVLVGCQSNNNGTNKCIWQVKNALNGN